MNEPREGAHEVVVRNRGNQKQLYIVQPRQHHLALDAVILVDLTTRRCLISFCVNGGPSST